ncbi:feebly protein [Microdochium bolleyi]|uniref:Feebly protein n=1 Tax=Microdochium bolleyi TaxID=196109 RepID=A0A136ISA9_9PEZI|nr:feebly protein [Microdochium bolleyi]
MGDEQPSTFQPSLVERVAVRGFNLLNRFIPWYKLPGILGAFNLAILRVELRGKNLFSTYPSGQALGSQDTHPTDERYLTARHSDGRDNSLEMPLMGCAGTRFGRNFPRSHCKKPSEEELWTPNPALVSARFMARREDEFKPASTLNLLAAAWIQFQTHDWFNHEDSDEKFSIPLPPKHDWPESHMSLPKTAVDTTYKAFDGKCPAYRNANTAWWDGSQIYGSSEATTTKLRDGAMDGKLRLNDNGVGAFILRDAQNVPQTGFSTNWWVGMEMLHTLFALEHNAICDKLKEVHPDWTSDRIFDKARLVNCALMAKIHTVEWTPAILAHPALQIGMNANWWGLAGETLMKLVGRIAPNSEIISGIPGSGVDNDGVPYSLTEEFVSVYRMHSLIPDNIAFFDARRGEHQKTVPISTVAFEHAQTPVDPVPKGGLGLDFADVFYSFGINYPGAITNNNYPAFLRDFTDPKGIRRDLGTVDILRDRERSVPRYCEFRRMLRMSVPTTFEEIVGGVAGKDGAKRQKLALDLADVYGGDISKVDAMVGMHSEPLIDGFGFSETAFRIFIVMASRRLKSDRFIAGRWDEDMYTREGLAWVQNSTMKDVLVRHFPCLKETLAKSDNAFAPWAKMDGSKPYRGRETNVVA